MIQQLDNPTGGSWPDVNFKLAGACPSHTNATHQLIRVAIAGANQLVSLRCPSILSLHLHFIAQAKFAFANMTARRRSCFLFRSRFPFRPFKTLGASHGQIMVIIIWAAEQAGCQGLAFKAQLPRRPKVGASRPPVDVPAAPTAAYCMAGAEPEACL